MRRNHILGLEMQGKTLKKLKIPIPIEVLQKPVSNKMPLIR
jgi:hypothetical protein